MATTKGKTKGDAAESDKPKTTRSSTPVKRKSKQEEPEPVESQEVVHKDQPALTINFQSWATPIVGVVMLVIGALAGFYARPTVLGQLPESAASVNPAVVIPTEDRSEEQQQLMASLIPRTRHFIGDPNAPVTIIEFGDFQ